MSARLRLASQLHQFSENLGSELRAQKEAQIAARRHKEKAEIERQINEAPIIAKRLIAGLPQFLKECANDRHTGAYIIYREGCKPWEKSFPNHESRKPSFNRHSMTEYAVRRYMKGIIQHVALWGLKQDFQVSLRSISDHRDFEFYQKEGRVIPVYMPGMFQGYTPTNSELLYLSW